MYKLYIFDRELKTCHISRALLTPLTISVGRPLPFSSVMTIRIHDPHFRLSRETVGSELQHRLQTFKQQQESLDVDSDTDIEYSFFIADLEEVYRQFLR